MKSCFNDYDKDNEKHEKVGRNTLRGCRFVRSQIYCLVPSADWSPHECSSAVSPNYSGCPGAVYIPISTPRQTS